MNRDEYGRLAALEPVHWWYRGFRDLLDRVFASKRFALPARPRVLDAGCGTGENLRFLERRLSPGYLGGFDLSPLALGFAREKAPGADVYLGDVAEPELHADGFDLILSCDVLYIPGVEAVRPGLGRLLERLADGGLFVLNLPAYDWLYSEHDVALGTRERFRASGVRRLLRELGLSVDLVTYRCCLLFPLIVLARIPSILGPKPAPAAARSDLRLPPAWANAALTRILAVENTAIVGGLPLPFGSSVFAVGRKTGGAAPPDPELERLPR